jgi:hypothetical protein
VVFKTSWKQMPGHRGLKSSSAGNPVMTLLNTLLTKFPTHPGAAPVKIMLGGGDASISDETLANSDTI